MGADLIFSGSQRRRARATSSRTLPAARSRARGARTERARLDPAALARLGPFFTLALGALLASAGTPVPQAGSIRGTVYDKDFEVPLAAAQVLAVETGQRATTTSQGSFVLGEVPPGRYTLVFSKDGYVRQVKADVVVEAGRLTDVEIYLEGEFTELDEFVVQDILQAAAGSEAALLKLRFESPALMDSIGAELMSRAGASDAASALRLVSGASIQDGKFAVIRGLPDRYVSSQMNGVRLPSADEDKRAVELDLFPSAILESLRVSKTFTPDQQGDASGGAVDVRLRGIPDEAIFQIKSQVGYNSNVRRRNDFLGYDGGGLDFWGQGHGRKIQTGTTWTGAAGTEEIDAPVDSKWALTAGGKHELDSGLRLGGLFSFFYERDSSFSNDGIDDSLWVTNPGEQPTPESVQGTPSDGDFKTALFDVTRAEQSVKWGGLATFGLESEHHSVALTYLYSRTAQDAATLAIDTRGKAYYFPGHDPNDPTSPGTAPSELNAAPYLRTETLEYTERTAGTLQLHGRHELTFGEVELGEHFHLQPLEVEWTLASSFANLDQPDKRQFGALWVPASVNPGAPPFVPPFTTPALWLPYKPAANFSLGNFQRIWKTIEEDSEQYTLSAKWPFEQWSGDKGYFKAGIFRDKVDRKFDQDTFSNFGDSGASFEADFEHPWSAVFPQETHPITASLFDVDYRGKQTISATYAMVDMPLNARVNVIGGARFESTKIGIVNLPDANATWFPPGASAPVQLNPGDADVDFSQDDVLPSIGVVYEPVDAITLRASYSQTVARQTFKELTPIQQQEFLGGPVFIGNPDLVMSALDNYDLRADYTPSEQSLVSISWFQKNIEDPIEYVQRIASFDYTTPVNYPKGRLSGFEFEVRQGLGAFSDALNGLSAGANATFIESEVTLPADEAAAFEDPAIAAPMRSRDMTNAPEHLYNLYLTWDVPDSGAQFGLFYTVQGDTLVAGAGESDGNFVPSVYAREYDTLNFSASQQLGKFLKLQFQAKNLTNPEIEEVYRADTIDGDVRKSSFTKGIDYSLGLSATFSF